MVHNRTEKQPSQIALQGTNIVFSHGSYDPWSALGATTSFPQRRVVSVTSKGATHCADTYPYYYGEPAGLQHARRLMADEVAYYFSLPSTFAPKKSSLTFKRAIWRLG